jgi:hypothetical protein
MCYMPSTFWRVHDTTYEFSADSAWSSQAGVPLAAPDRDLCLVCGGDGTDPDECDDEGNSVPCTSCGGEGSFQRDRGYSCCASPEDLISYFSGHLGAAAGDTVITFEGERTGTCPDGEPLAVPIRVIATATWAEFTRAHA